MRKSSIRNSFALTTSIVALLGFAPTVLLAQTAPQQEQTVFVTGSRIAGQAARAVSPVAILDREKILETATIDLDDLLKTQNQFSASIGSTSSSALSDAHGASTLDMRGMGQNRTLTLINGTRATPFGFRNSVDVNTIPTSLIKRIEYLTGGASAVYGADAVAGVANFILNDKFHGLEITASGGMAEEGDATSLNYGITAGRNLGDGRGNITGHLSYADRGSLSRIDRPWAAVEVNDANTPFTTTNSRGGNFARSGGGSVFNLTAQGGIATSPSFNFTNTGGIQQASFGDILTSFEHFIGANTRQNAALFFNYDLTENLEFWARATVTAIENTSNFSYATVAGTAAATFQVRRDSPFVTPALATIFAGAFNRNYADTAAGTDMFKATVSRSLFELGPRTDVTDRVSSQFAMGLKGKFSNHLSWDFSVINGHSDEDVLRFNEGSPARLAQGLNVTNVGGVAKCVDQSNGCVPINFFGPNAMSAEAVAWVEGPALYFGRNRDQLVVSGNLFGDSERFFSFKGGPIKWSLGVEFRDEYGDMYWDPRILAGDYFGGTRRQDASAKFDLTELYTEVRAPILSDLPFIKHFELEAAYRISDHSLAGTYDNSKIGFNWQVDNNLRIRGSQQTVFRAPNIGELWGVVGATVASSTLRASHYDPCTTTTDAAIRAVCVATGAPAAPFTKNITVLNFPFGGDATIKPETGETYTLGFVYTPTYFKDFTFGVDYWHIQLEDAIGGLSSDAMVRLCYDVSKDANSVYCQRIKRDVTGNLTDISLVDINVSNFETAGYDFNASYKLRLPEAFPGDSINFDLRGGLMDTFIKQATPLEAKVNCIGKFHVPGSCSDSGVGSRPMPTIRGSLGISWISKPLTLRATWRHFGDVIEGPSPTGTYTTFLHKHIEAQNYLDLGATWRINSHFRASFSVTNALDTEPPLIGNFAVDANTIPAVYDVIGRRYGLSLVYKF